MSLNESRAVRSGVAIMSLLPMLCALHATAQAQEAVPEVHVLQVRDNIYMLVGEGGNITMQVGDDGVLLVDTQFARMSEPIWWRVC